MKSKKPPIGAKPWGIWLESCVEGEPSLLDLIVRYQDVMDAVQRYREVGLVPKSEWLLELGTHVVPMTIVRVKLL